MAKSKSKGDKQHDKSEKSAIKNNLDALFKDKALKKSKKKKKRQSGPLRL